VSKQHATQNLVGDSLPISVKEAKKLLGVNVKAKLNDEQIETVITLLDSIAHEFIQSKVPNLT